MNVAVIGASDKEDRYAYKAIKLLKEQGHKIFPVHQRVKTVQGLSVYPTLADVGEPLHTVTLYVGADVSTRIKDVIIQKQPQRVIFNPGAENPELEKLARENGIQVLRACTIILLKTNQF